MLLLSPIFLSTNYMYTNNILEYNNIVRFTVNVVMDLKKKNEKIFGQNTKCSVHKILFTLNIMYFKKFKIKNAYIASRTKNYVLNSSFFFFILSIQFRILERNYKIVL